MVYSKGVLNHVLEKKSLFQQVYSMLKANGLFVIADWLFPDGDSHINGPIAHETQLH